MAEICEICKNKIGMMTGKVRFLDGYVCTKCYQKAGYGIGWNDTDQMAKMASVSIARWKRMNDPNAAEPEEYRIKCNTCGHIYCYTEDDIALNKFYLRSAKTDTNIGAFNSLFGNALIGQADYASAERSLDKVKDFNHCPKCNSGDIRRLSEQEFELEKANASNATTANQTAANFSIADELKKFKELLDMGIITQEEFDAQKSQLLSRNSTPTQTTQPQQRSVTATPTQAPSNVPPAKPGTWNCSCGRNHPNYVSSCVCGVNKSDMMRK